MEWKSLDWVRIGEMERCSTAEMVAWALVLKQGLLGPGFTAMLRLRLPLLGIVMVWFLNVNATTDGCPGDAVMSRPMLLDADLPRSVLQNDIPTLRCLCDRAAKGGDLSPPGATRH